MKETDILIIGGGITEGQVNYDTNRKVLQIKGAELKRSILLEGVEFYDCTIEGDVKNCLFENCIIRNSKLEDCTIYSNNMIKFSKIIDCDYLGESNSSTGLKKYSFACSIACLLSTGASFSN